MTGDAAAVGPAPTVDAYLRLIADLDGAGAQYRVIDHAAEGRTDRVSALRGNDVAQAARCV